MEHCNERCQVTLSDLANLAEIVGGVAVVVSLVYLAVQVRQNTHSVRSATLQSNTALWNSIISSLGDPGSVQAYAAGLTGKKDISPLTYTQFFLLCMRIFVAFEDQHFQFRQGILDEETYKGYERSISEQFLAFPGFRIWWEQSKDVFSPQFVEYLDGLIGRTEFAEPDKFYKQWQDFPRH